MPLLVRADARALPLPDASVDLVVTSPPYFALRSYTDDGEHYAGQIGSEATPGEFLNVLIECTREMVRVLKPSGSTFVNLGDKYSTGNSGDRNTGFNERSGNASGKHAQERSQRRSPRVATAPPKSLLLLPERYRIRCVDELGLSARAVIVWSKPNGLPESVTDRVRRSHEDWVHLTKAPRYYSAVDEIRDGYSDRVQDRQKYAGRPIPPSSPYAPGDRNDVGNAKGILGFGHGGANPLGKLPGSVWEIPTQPLNVPDHIAHADCCDGRRRAGCEQGLDHYAAFPMEWPRRLILGWCPREVCTACREGRRPMTERERFPMQRVHNGHMTAVPGSADGRSSVPHGSKTTITGYACACPDTAAPSTPGVVLDPFGGTGTAALVATMLGRRGISMDLSGDYLRLARWRCTDPKERARAAGLDSDAVAAVPAVAPDQLGLWEVG